MSQFLKIATKLVLFINLSFSGLALAIGDSIRFDDRVSQQSVDELLENLESSLSNAVSSRVVLELKSDGGDLESALRFFHEVDNLKRQGLELITYVRNHEECASSCTVLFAAGDKRYAGKNSSFYFHQTQVKVVRGDKSRDNIERLREHYASMWLEAIASVDAALAEKLDTKGTLILNGAEWTVRGTALATSPYSFVTNLESPNSNGPNVLSL